MTQNKVIDLDIDNYELDDILRLFDIPTNFDEEDMKRAKQRVLKSHPDKSRLPPKYFLFYSKAYKVLFQIYEFRNKSSNKKQAENYEDVIPDSAQTEKGKEKALANFFNKNSQLKESKNFNNWFNEQFEKNKLENEDDNGYGDWLTSNDDLEPEKNITLSQMGEEFGKKKAQVRALVVQKDIEEIYSNQSIQGTFLTSNNGLNGSNGQNGPNEFNSDLFSSLPYQDLRQAHVNSVIPVTEEDYNRVQKFNNVNEYTSYRNNQDTKPLSEIQAMEYLNRKNNLDNEQATKRAYELAKQTELAEKNNQDFWGNILKITNK